MHITLRQIRYFLAVVEAGKISSAASKLHVSQSAVTVSIQNLEDFLDTQLFERHAHGVTLTYEGHLFRQRARDVLTAVEDASHIPSKAQQKVEGVLRISVSYTVAGYFLPAYIARFTQSFPRIDVRLTEASRPEIEESLLSDRCDIAVLLTSNLVNREEIAYETLVRSRRRLWVSSDHCLLKRKSLTLHEISDEPYIMLTVDEANSTTQRYWCHTPYRPNVAFSTSSVEAVRSMVSNGIGITILSDMVYRPWSLEGKRVEVMTVSDDVPSMDIGLAWRRDQERKDATDAFREFMLLATGR